MLTRDGDAGDAAVELLGTGESSDGYHMSTPHPEGIGAERAMRAALAQARLPFDAIDYINLHGTGTPVNDAVEAAAIAHEPHRIAFYLYDLASEFHALWTKGRDLPHLRFIINHDAELTKARLAMVQGVVSVLASGLAVLGVHAPTEMR